MGVKIEDFPIITLGGVLKLKLHCMNQASGYFEDLVPHQKRKLPKAIAKITPMRGAFPMVTSTRPYRPVSFDNRTALEHITMMAERNAVSWEVVRALVAHNRKGKPHFTECSVSLNKRGIIPQNNLYGILAA